MSYELKNGLLRAEVTARGAELTGLWDGDGIQYIWEGDPAYWAGRNPNLFPLVGDLEGGQVLSGDKLCKMGRHGFARRKDFIPVRQTEDEIVLELREDEDSLAQYPFPFRFQVIHKLLPDGFSTTYRVENTGSEPMPYCVGGHPAFRCPLLPGEAFEDYRLVFEQEEDAASPLLTPAGRISFQDTARFLSGSRELALDRAQLEKYNTLMFRELRSRWVSLINPATGRGVRLDFSQFPMVAFWTAPGADYLCLEPWQGCAGTAGEGGQFTDKPYHVVLAPGEARAHTYTITLLGI